jgi:transcriptional regulator with GAF, ATPase, and Fis domain
MFCFRIFHPQGSSIVSLREPAITLGSSHENEVVVEDIEVPPLALRMALGADGYIILPCTPKFKLEVNGKKVSQGLLKVGDILQMGSHRLIFDNEVTNKILPPSSESNIPKGLSKLCALVAEERDLKVLLSKTMHLLLETMGGNEAFLFTLNESGQPAIAVSTRVGDAPILFSDTIVEQVLRTKRGLFLGNALANPAYANSPSIIDLKLHSVLCCPITAAGRTSGLIYLGSNLPTISFGADDLRELEIYALVVGCLINHLGYIAMQSKILAALQDEAGQPGMVATCPPMKKVLDEARIVAQGEIAVLLEGETGTGKDVLAHYIHRNSRRSAKPFLVINCSTLRGELLASELFGHKKGAFTGAIQDQQGFFAAAHGGTLFLDEIGEMDLALQAMLLRTLESGMIRPVGQTAEIRVDVRLICATNRQLEASIAKGEFRQDLYYRINQHGIQLPPLRDRGEDMLLLAHYFLEKSKAIYPEKSITGIHPESLFAIRRYKWPGNIRELANVVNKAVLFSTSAVITLTLPKENLDRWMDMEEATRHFQLDHLQKALDFSGGDKDKAAAMLGMGRSTFFRYLSQARGQDIG